MSNNAFLNQLTKENVSQFSEQLNNIFLFDLVNFIENAPKEMQILVFTALKPEKAATVFEYLPFAIQKQILNALPAKNIADLLNSISPDDRTSLLEELPHDQVKQLLKYLSLKERELSIKLLGYKENSVGRLMTPDYIAVKMDWTVKQVLDYIRENGRDSETINVIYAVDDHGVLLDDFRIRQFILASLDTKVEELSDRKFLALNVNEDIEDAINTFRKYGRIALPVIDDRGVMLGIVTIDDIMHETIEKDTEDIYRFGGLGIEGLKESYMRIPFFQLIQKRVGWLVFLFLGELLTASAMGIFQNELEKAVVLALFLPLIISSGGNAGSQASTLIVRALALGEVRLRDWWRIFHREIFSGLLLGCILGAIGFFRITAWSLFSTIYGGHWILLALTVFLALIGVVTWGTLSGAMLPLILKRMGVDPATSSAPFVATLVDVTGIIIYFSVAYVVLHGTLL